MIKRLLMTGLLQCAAVCIATAAADDLGKAAETALDRLDKSNVIWDSPSGNSLGSMPLGNGDVGANVWVEPGGEQGGDLLFYISKVDALDEKCLLPKLGKVRVRFSPNPFAAGKPFRQELVLRDGMILIHAGSGAEEVKLRVWIDANNPAIHVGSESAAPLDATVSVEWLRNVTQVPGAAESDGLLPVNGTAGVFLRDQADRLVWAYRNVSSTWKQRLIAQKSAALAEKVTDPLLHLTSGCLVKGAGFSRDKANSLRLKEKSRKFDIAVQVLSCPTDTAAAWFSRIEEQSSAADKADPEKALAAHRDWWRGFWDRSHIDVQKCGEGAVRLDGYLFTQHKETIDEYCKSLVIDSATNAFQITQRYALERFAQACASRTRDFPSPFNGSIFTMDLPAGAYTAFRGSGGLPKAVTADHRDWGTLPIMWQNTRHPYWSMLARGDYDTMAPVFKAVRDSLEVSKDRCRQWYGHDGAFMTEAMLWKGVSVFDRPPTHLQYHYLGSIEMTSMMCDYFEHTQDRAFVQETLLPCADEFIKFYELHYPKRDEHGKMVMEPAGVAETYQSVTNPVTEVSGLRYLLGKLVSFDEALIGRERKAHWAKFLQEMPDVPQRTLRGMELLAPGWKYTGRAICETPELYAVWPFRQTAVENNGFLANARQSFHVRQLSLDGTSDDQSWETGGWQSAPIWAAYLGLPREAARLVSINFDDRFPCFTIKNTDMAPPAPGHPRPRFPGFWETKMDYTPDNDHGAVSANAIQSMLLQSDGRKIYLLPAWPEDWDVSFKLHAARQTTVECVYRGGKVQSLKVTPLSRLADVVDFSSYENRVRTLVAVACADRNYLFGLPPMLDGQPKPGPTTGSWLEKYGECLAGVKAAPWPGSVYKGSTLYVFDLAGGEPKAPQVPAKLVGSKRLTKKDPSPVSILKLEYDQPLEAFALAAAAEGSLTAGRTAQDGMIDFGKPETFNRIEFTIDNPGHRRGEGKTFSLEVKQQSGAWRPVFRGKVYGCILGKEFPPVTAQQVRLSIDAPVRQFDLFAPSKQ